MRSYFEHNESDTYQAIDVAPEATSIQLPPGVTPAEAILIRDGADLLIETSADTHFFVPDYYLMETAPDLKQGDAPAVSGEFLSTLPDKDSMGQYAQAEIPGIPGVEGLDVSQSPSQSDTVSGEPIGQVEDITGSVTVIRADATTTTLQIGDPVYQGDTLETGPQGGLGITLADTSTFSLGSDSEMVLDELVYDPGSQQGSSVLSLIEGTASYVSGQIAKISPDAVAINTPVATIGIRGTKVFLEYTDGRFNAVNLIETTLDGETPGEIVIFSPDGTPIGSTSQANRGWSWQGDARGDIATRQFTPDQVDLLTRETLNHLPPSLAEKALEAQELEQALKETAEIAAQEAEEAAQKAANAELEAQAFDQAAQEAQAELETLKEEALSEEEKLALLQEQLEQAIASGASQTEIFSLQQALNKLEYDITLIWQNVETAKNTVQEISSEASQAQQFFLIADKQAERAEDAAQIALDAARNAYEVAENAFTQAREYVGYEVNADNPNENSRFASLFGEQSGQGTPQSQTPNTDNKEDDGDSGVFIPHANDDNTAADTDFEVSQLTDDTSDPIVVPNDANGPTTGTTSEDPDDQSLPVETDNTSEEDATPVSLNGKGVDGYLDGATVFIDLDRDGVQDANETNSTTTDSQGNFSLSTAASDYFITMTGGTDIATGKAFYGVLQAPAGSSVVTPLTTLLANGLSQSDLQTAFGLDSSIDLTTTDPVAGASDSDIAKVAAIGVQLQNTILQAASAIEGATTDGLDDGATGSALFDAITNAISTQGSSFDITDSTGLQSIITTAAGDLLSGSDLTRATDAAANTAAIISSSNTVIKDYIDEGGSGDDLLSSLAQVAVVADDAATSLETAVRNDDDLSTLEGQYSSTNLQTRIDGANIGDVNGDGDTNTVNAAPTVSGAVALSTNEDTSFTVTHTQLLSKASDDSALTIRDLSADNATITQLTDTSWSIQPTANSSADITLSYKVTDGVKTTDASAVVSVTAVNDDPTVSSTVNLSGAEDTDLTITQAQLIANASDVDGDTLSVQSLSVENGTLVNNEDNTWTYTPLANATDDVTFSYTISDGNGGTANTTATASFTSVNDDPVTSRSTSLSGTEDTDLTITQAQLLANASDVDGDSLSVQNLSADGGTLVDNEDNTWTFTPDGDSTADVSFSYTVSDGNGGTTNTTATASFSAVNDDPTVSSAVSLSGTEDTDLTITQAQLLTNASDVDGDSLSVESLSVASGTLVDNEDNTWTYTPIANSTDDVTFSYNISDGNSSVAASAVASFAEDGTTEGTSGVDTITGTSGNDTITALADDDTITGGAGDDYIDGGADDNTAVFSGNLADYTFSTDDDGNLMVSDGNVEDGDDGSDTLVNITNFQFSDQTINSVPGESSGDGTDDEISGGNGADTIDGGAGNDTIWSHNGQDVVDGGADDDFIWTGNGNDTTTGGTGADYVYTGNGDDVIILASGDVTLDGGRGEDTLRLSNGDGLDMTSNTVELLNLEIIDMNTDSTANSLTLGSSDITSMSNNDSLVIDGDGSDSLSFSDTGWTEGNTADGYTTYDHSSSGAQVSVGENINIPLNQA